MQGASIDATGPRDLTSEVSAEEVNKEGQSPAALAAALQGLHQAQRMGRSFPSPR